MNHFQESRFYKFNLVLAVCSLANCKQYSKYCDIISYVKAHFECLLSWFLFARLNEDKSDIEIININNSDHRFLPPDNIKKWQKKSVRTVLVLNMFFALDIRCCFHGHQRVTRRNKPQRSEGAQRSALSALVCSRLALRAERTYGDHLGRRTDVRTLWAG